MFDSLSLDMESTNLSLP